MSARSVARGAAASGVAFLVSLGAMADQAVTHVAPPQAAAPEAKLVPLASDDPQMRIGAAIYTDTCMACHRSSGTGVDLLFPKLAGSETVQQDDASYLIVTVLQGGRAEATREAPTGPAMPSLGWRLSDEQVADVLTYVRNTWGNAAPKVTAAQVGDLRGKL